MTLKEGIKDYIAKNGLQAKCDERKITIDDICDYVTSQARKALDGHSGAIDDTTVFNWVIHYLEDEYKNKKVEEEAKPEPEPEKHDVPRETETQLSLFDNL